MADIRTILSAMSYAVMLSQSTGMSHVSRSDKIRPWSRGLSWQLRPLSGGGYPDAILSL